MRWLLLSLVLAVGITQSQEPAQSPTKCAESSKTQVAKGEQNAKDQCGTEKQPLFVKVVDAKPPFMKGMTAEEATAAFTGLLVIVGTLTAIILIVQSVFILLQVKAARREFLAVHPPKLVVRRVAFAEGKPGEIQYIITNIGESDAEIIQGEVRAIFDTVGKRPFFPPYKGIIEQLRGLKIAVRDQKVLFEPCVGLAKSMEHVNDVSYKVFLIGWMTYKNRGGATGYTAFGRIFDPLKGGFVIIEDDNNMPEHDRWEYRA